LSDSHRNVSFGETWYAILIRFSGSFANLLTLGCIHGDLKPRNILVYEDHQRDGALFVRITDFGHATIVSGMEDLVKLPESKPWAISAPEYHHKGYSFDAAIKAMVYSLGVCCLWLVLYNKPSDQKDDFYAEAEEAKATLSQVWMLDLAQKRLHPSEWISSVLQSLLSEVFQLTLTPCQNRAASAQEVLLLLQEAFRVSSNSDLGYTGNGREVVCENYQFYPDLVGLEEQNSSIDSLDMLRFKVSANLRR
jgi:serine/threonine protein kinase